MYERGSIHFPLTVAVAVVGFTGAALKLEEVRPLLIAAIAFQAAVGPWTLLASKFLPHFHLLISILISGLVGPTNNRLVLMRDQIREARAARKINKQDAQIEGYDPLGEMDQAEAIQLMAKWRRLHRFRLVAGTVAWALGIAALRLA